MPAGAEAGEGERGGLGARRAGAPALRRGAQEQAGAAGVGAARRRELARLCLCGRCGRGVRRDRSSHPPGGAQQEERGSAGQAAGKTERVGASEG